MLHQMMHNVRVMTDVATFARHLMFQCGDLVALMSDLLLGFTRTPPIAVPARRATMFAGFAKFAQFLAQLYLIGA